MFEPRPDVETMRHDDLVDYARSLEFQLGEFKASDESLVNLKRRFNCRPSGARLLALLSHGKPVSRERLTALLAPNPDQDVKIVDVQLCHVRKHIAGTGVKIETIWGLGLQMTEGTEIVRAAMAGDVA